MINSLETNEKMKNLINDIEVFFKKTKWTSQNQKIQIHKFIINVSFDLQPNKI